MLIAFIVPVPFLVSLGGGLLLLASGVRAFTQGVGRVWFLVGFALFLAATGLALFWRLPGHEGLDPWLLTSGAILLIEIIFRRNYWLAVFAGLWTALISGSACTFLIFEVFANTRIASIPPVAYLLLLTFVLASLSAILALTYRSVLAG